MDGGGGRERGDRDGWECLRDEVAFAVVWMEFRSVKGGEAGRMCSLSQPIW